MVVDGIGCDSIKPVAKLLFIALETPEVFNSFKKYLGSNVFGLCPFKKPMHTVAKYRIVMPAI